VGIHKEVADLIAEMQGGTPDYDGVCLPWAAKILEAVAKHLREAAHRIETENAPALRELGERYGDDWTKNEARCRELAALFVRDFSFFLELHLRFSKLLGEADR